jgi:dihydrolipoamide dehydrogenase
MTDPTPTAADVLVLGGGPGGYVAAIRAAQLGLTTVCVEMDKTLGGTCVNVGCIPSKALLQSSEHYEFARLHAAEHGVQYDGVRFDLGAMMKRKDDVVGQNTKGVEFLFRKNKITWAKGRGTVRQAGEGRNLVEVTGADGAVTTYAPKHLILATGSVPIELPFLPFDEERVLSNVGALKIPEVPKRLIVVGGGVIGLELGSGVAPARRDGHGRRARADHPPRPGRGHRQGGDAQSTQAGARAQDRRPGHRRRARRATWCACRSRRTARRRRSRPTTCSSRWAASRRCTASTPRRSASRSASAAEIAVDDQMRTSVPTVYAIGDVTGGKLLAHKAEEEGVIAAEVIAGKPVEMHYRSMPSVVYTWPEVASVGLAEHEVKASGRAYKTGKFPFSANGRARTMGETTGLVKFIADAETDELLGCHMMGPNVSDLIQEVVLAFEYRGSSEDIGITVHSHPTLSETVKEAALAVLGRPIHM